MFGFLNIHKTAGATSRHTVNQIQRLVRPSKIGHAGTLDPLATGVLVVAVGPATRLVDYVHRFAKSYDATFLLGRDSDTEDITGQVTEYPDARQPTVDELLAAARRLTGEIAQRPPAYSALKVQGERAYDLARRGERVELQERIIQVHRLELIGYDYPELRLRIECSTGTYVRSLGRDLASSLGTHAVMMQLVRTAVGPFSLPDACFAETLDRPAIESGMLPPTIVFPSTRTIELDSLEVRRISNGQSIERREHGHCDDVAAVDSEKRLVAVLSPVAPDRLRPVLTFRHT